MPIGTRRDFSSAVVRSRRSVLATERDARGVDDPGTAVLVSRGVVRGDAERRSYVLSRVLLPVFRAGQ